MLVILIDLSQVLWCTQYILFTIKIGLDIVIECVFYLKNLTRVWFFRVNEKWYFCIMKLKKHISIILTFLILISNIGFAFNVHYCGGKISSVSFGSEAPVVQDKNDCCFKNKAKKISCCKDKKIVFQKKMTEKIVKTFSFQLDTPFLIPVYQSFVFNAFPGFKNNVLLSYYCDANAPPLYKLYSQYLLYDNV